MSSIVPTSPQEFRAESMDRLGRVPANVRWKKVPEASYYYLLLSKYNDFQEGRLFKTVVPKQFLMIYPNIPYYWSVQAFDEQGRRLPFESFKPHRVMARYEGLRPVTNDLGMNDEEAQERSLASTETPQDTFEESGKVESVYDYSRKSEQTGVSAGSASSKAPRQEMVVRVVEAYPTWLKRNKFWISTEAGLFQFGQSHTVLSDVSASGLMFPSFGLNFQTRSFWDSLSARMYFKNTVGKFETKSTVTLIDSDFQFLQYGAVGQWTFMPGRRNEFTAYLGLDRQTNPYFIQISPTSITVQDMVNTNALIGARWNFNPNNRWKHHVDVGYYHLLSTEASDLASNSVSGKSYELQLGSTRTFTRNGFFAGGNMRAVLRDFNEDVITSSSQASQGSRDTKYYAFEINAGIVF